jgi:biopolymer transport protein ExbB/TolQ
MIAATGIEEVLFQIANSLRIPVFIAATVALAFLLFDLGAFFVELGRRRRGGRTGEVQAASANARVALGAGDQTSAQRALMPLASSAQMADTLAELVDHHGEPGSADRRAKALADFDLTSLRKLERSRMLVRFGPALGLMGTLIPLSPALDGLAKGDVTQLSQNLRVAFSVTVIGLLIGAVAFAISLVRDRLYAQDLSDLEYVAAALEPQDHAPLEPHPRAALGPQEP